MSTRPNIHQQIEELLREQRMRAQVYPGLIGRGKLRHAEADEHSRRLAAALETLCWVRDNRELIVAAKAAGNPFVETPHPAGSAGHPLPQGEREV